MEPTRLQVASDRLLGEVQYGAAEHGNVVYSRPSQIVGLRRKELVVRFHDVCHLMGSGDGFWFAGRKLHSYLIRIVTNSNVSHCGILHRYADKSDAIKLIDIVEGIGGRHLDFYDEVKKYPGQYYWSPVNYTAWSEFRGDGSAEEGLRIVHKPYGRGAVILQALTRCMLSREIMYLFQDKIDRIMVGKQPFCSMGQSLWSEIGGGIDPVPGRSPWLTTPQDTWQSMLWMPDKYCLIP